MTQLGLNWLAHQENVRSNKKRESQTQMTLDETKRSNQAKEQIAYDELSETQRSNKAREAETYRSNVARETENTRSNMAKEAENYRSNVAAERDRDAQLVESKRANRANEDIKRTGLSIDYQNLAQRIAEAAQNLDIAEKQALIKLVEIFSKQINTSAGSGRSNTTYNVQNYQF